MDIAATGDADIVQGLDPGEAIPEMIDGRGATPTAIDMREDGLAPVAKRMNRFGDAAFGVHPHDDVQPGGAIERRGVAPISRAADHARLVEARIGMRPADDFIHRAAGGHLVGGLVAL